MQNVTAAIRSARRRQQVCIALHSHFFVQRVEDNSVSVAKYVPFNESSFSFPLETVKARDWESQGGRHSGGYVLDELQQIVRKLYDTPKPVLDRAKRAIRP